MSSPDARIELVDKRPSPARAARGEEPARRSASIGRRWRNAMSDVMCPGSAAEALEMLMSALRYLAAADATAMTSEEQARCLRVLEQATAIGAAARTSMLGAFTSGRGYSADAQ